MKFNSEIITTHIHAYASQHAVTIRSEDDVVVAMINIDQTKCSNADQLDIFDIVNQIESVDNINDLGKILNGITEMYAVENITPRAIDICVNGEYTFPCGKSVLVVGFTDRDTLVASLVNQRGFLLDYTEYEIVNGRIGGLCAYSKYCAKHIDQDVSQLALQELVMNYPDVSELREEMTQHLGVNTHRYEVLFRYGLNFDEVTNLIRCK